MVLMEIHVFFQQKKAVLVVVVYSTVTVETLSLTYNSYQLLTNSAPTAVDIANHYNITGTSIYSSLKYADAFCQKTGLTFNQLLELTAQKNYLPFTNDMLVNDMLVSVYKKFLALDKVDAVNITEYGAVYLAGIKKEPLFVTYLEETDNPDADYQFYAKPMLSFTEDNVVELAGRAEKII